MDHQQYPEAMNRKHKQLVRRASKKFVGEKLPHPIPGNVVSLPLVRVLETRRHFANYPHVQPGRFFFFEKDIKKFEDMSRAFTRARRRWRDVTLFLDDLFTREALSLIPDVSVTVFDLDFMASATVTMVRDIGRLLLQKANPSGFMLFLNTAYSRCAVSKEESVGLHYDLLQLVTEQHPDLDIHSSSGTYSDGTPMMYTTIVGV